jgi:5-methylcytosine-specific restriction endonuclease McrA
MEHRNCLECGASFVPSRFAKRHDYCSNPCSAAAYLKSAPEQTCRYCLRPFRTRDKRGIGYCSRACALKAPRIGASSSLVGRSCSLTWRTCAECGGRYHSRMPKRHCWPHTTSGGQPSTYQRIPARERLCEGCGAVILTRAYVKRCPTCLANQRRETRRDIKQRRRATKRGATVERVLRRVVFERDGWRCQLCGLTVDRDAQVPAHRAPTLDHIVPLSAGGEHSYRNVQLAHFICNTRRGSTGDAQMRLIA